MLNSALPKLNLRTKNPFKSETMAFPPFRCNGVPSEHSAFLRLLGVVVAYAPGNSFTDFHEDEHWRAPALILFLCYCIYTALASPPLGRY